MKFNVVGVGEVLWDLLESGPQLGGAPANFAYHARALGAQTHIITRVGADEPGREILRRFRSLGLSDSSVQTDPVKPTGIAGVSLAADGVAHFTIHEDVAWDFLTVTPESLAAAAHADAICFGTLGQRSPTSRASIQQFVAATRPGALRVLDINLRPPYYSRDLIERSLQLSNVLKLNDDELGTLTTMFRLSGSTHNQIAELARTFGDKVVALTRGPNGSLLYQDGRWSDCPSRPVQVVDTVGAGDSFAAALVLGLLLNLDLDEINSRANDIARFVCSQPGATPSLPAELVEKFQVASAR
jgi:fructokinase